MPRIPGAGDRIPEPKLSYAADLGVTDGYRTLVLRTERGPVETHLYEAEEARGAVLFVGGVGGGFDSPAHNLYPRLAGELAARGVSALHVRFRRSTDLPEAVHDVLAGLWLLDTRGVQRVVLVGHSFGGAVVISAGVRSEQVTAVVTLATQSYGTNEVASLSPRPLLLLHGTDDEILPATSSWSVHRMAREPKTLELFEGARHCLDEMADEVHDILQAWLLKQLGAAVPRLTEPRA